MVKNRVTLPLSFDSVKEFDEGFERKGENTGHFFSITSGVRVGQRVFIRIHIKGLEFPIFLEGVVAWRRVQNAGPSMRRGIFVQLLDRERARLDGIVTFLRKDARGTRDRRRFERLPLFTDAEYATAKGVFKSEVRNISQGGVYLRCLGPLLSIGAKFPVTLYLDGKSSKAVVLQSRVAWIDMFDDNKGMGVLFDKDQPELKAVGRSIRRIKKQLAILAK